MCVSWLPTNRRTAFVHAADVASTGDHNCVTIATDYHPPLSASFTPLCVKDLVAKQHYRVYKPIIVQIFFQEEDEETFDIQRQSTAGDC